MKEKIKPPIIIFVACLIILAGFWVFKYFSEPAKADSDDNVSGWAWSETIGWISFNCTDTSCASSNYGVHIDLSTGNFSGYAWSENIGWISFAPGGPYPAAPNYSAKYDSGTGKVTGWAKALADGGGWDGWILFGKEAGGWANQVTIDSGTGDFNGWAWGSDVVGWVNLNGPNYKVTVELNSSPTTNCIDTETWYYCTDSRHPKLKWNYTDDDGDPQESYQVQADETSDFSSSPLKLDTGVFDSDSKEYTVSVSHIKRGIDLNWNIKYYWRVKVKDDQGNWSEWCLPICDFTTPKHAYPDVYGDESFTLLPTNPSALEPVQFTDNSECYDDVITGSDCSGDSGKSDSFSWTFPNANPLTSSLENPVATPSAPGPWDVKLKVTDSDGFWCEDTQTVNVSQPLPEWREVRPK